VYSEDAVLEFPQSGERFVGIENLRAWRSDYPAPTTAEFREVRGRDDFWVAEISISYDQGPRSFGISMLEVRDERIVRESIYVAEGWGATRVAGAVEVRALALAPRARCRWSGWRGPESNRGHHDFQSCALPTELPRRSR
jgi:hypothetical protein